MSRYAICSTLAALSVALAAGGLAGAAVAAPEAGEPAVQAPSHQGTDGKDSQGRHRNVVRDGLWVPGVGPLFQAQVDSLKLDTAQRAMFQTAQQAQRDLFKARRDVSAARHALLEQQLQSGKLDPRALSVQDEQGNARFRQQADQVRDRWLAVWDSLTDDQREQITQLVKARQGDKQARHAKMRAHHAQMTDSPTAD